MHNMQQFRGHAHKGTQFACAIKGNAYGHGLREIVKMATPVADYFLINSIEELRALRQISKKPALLLGYVFESDIKEAIQLGCIMGIFSCEQFARVQKESRRLKKKQEVHLATDSLLGREGFLLTQLPKVFTLHATDTSFVSITGIYAHFANIEDTNNTTHAERQIAEYKEMLEVAQHAGYTNLKTHISATSGFLVYHPTQGPHAIVRIGIGMYGLWPSEHLEFHYGKKISLKPVLSWKTHIAQVKTLPAGRTIGYGLTYMTKVPTKIALIPQGYADGYSRSLSNKGEVLIGGKRCRVLGRVAMNMFVVDVSKIRAVAEGDEVVLLGAQGKENMSAEGLASASDTINYEVTTRISALLPRIID